MSLLSYSLMLVMIAVFTLVFTGLSAFLCGLLFVFSVPRLTIIPLVLVVALAGFVLVFATTPRWS